MASLLREVVRSRYAVALPVLVVTTAAGTVAVLDIADSVGHDYLVSMETAAPRPRLSPRGRGRPADWSRAVGAPRPGARGAAPTARGARAEEAALSEDVAMVAGNVAPVDYDFESVDDPLLLWGARALMTRAGGVSGRPD